MARDGTEKTTHWIPEEMQNLINRELGMAFGVFPHVEPLGLFPLRGMD